MCVFLQKNKKKKKKCKKKKKKKKQTDEAQGSQTEVSRSSERSDTGAGKESELVEPHETELTNLSCQRQNEVTINIFWRYYWCIIEI